MSETQNVQIQLKALELLDSCINNPRKPLKANTGFQFDINLEHRYRKEGQLLIVLCTISVFNEDLKELLGKVRTSCIFHVANWDDFFDQESKVLNLPKNTITSFNSIAISTTRGMMFSFFRGTFLHSAILPIINPNDFSSESLEE